MSVYEYDEKLHEKTLIEIGREEGREEGRLTMLISLICRKLSKGKDFQTIADELDEEAELIEEICKIAETQAPEYNEKKILEQLTTTAV